MIGSLHVMTYDTVENLIGEGKGRLPNQEMFIPRSISRQINRLMLLFQIWLHA